jgi:hypothetical protein
MFVSVMLEKGSKAPATLTQRRYTNLPMIEKLCELLTSRGSSLKWQASIFGLAISFFLCSVFHGVM